MKCFIWQRPEEIQWGDSIIFVMAPTLREARKAAIQEVPHLEKHLRRAKPSKVFNKTHAEYYRWEE